MGKEEQVRIEWRYEGKPDFSSGTGAYPAEKALAFVSALIIPAFLIYYASWRSAVDWSAIQFIVALVLAFDVGGGLVSNALNSCKRFYHTPAKREEGKLGVALKQPMLFAALHVHPFVVGGMYGGGDWAYGAAWYASLLLSAALVLRSPLYLRRPLSLLLVMLSFLASLYGFEPIAGFEWLMPLLFMKIVYGHLVREEPYRKV